MSGELRRFGKLVGKVAVDKTFGSVRDLFQGLCEERARRFVAWLESELDERQATAETAINALLVSTNGQRILRHVCRDVLFGTESISLAAMALISSRASAQADNPFWYRAAAAIDGLQNEDALVFLALLQYIEDFYVGRENWLPTFHFDTVKLTEPHWDELKTVCGLGEREIYGGLVEVTRRRLLLADVSRGRAASVNEVAPLVAFLTADTSHYFQLLGRALEIAEPDLYTLLAPLKTSIVDAMCDETPRQE